LKCLDGGIDFHVTIWFGFYLTNLVGRAVPLSAGTRLVEDTHSFATMAWSIAPLVVLDGSFHGLEISAIGADSLIVLPRRSLGFITSRFLLFFVPFEEGIECNDTGIFFFLDANRFPHIVLLEGFILDLDLEHEGFAIGEASPTVLRLEVAHVAPEVSVFRGFVGLEEADDNVFLGLMFFDSIEDVDLNLKAQMELHNVVLLVFEIHTIKLAPDLECLCIYGSECSRSNLYKHRGAVPINVR
jgi:hypothetical protein